MTNRYTTRKSIKTREGISKMSSNTQPDNKDDLEKKMEEESNEGDESNESPIAQFCNFLFNTTRNALGVVFGSDDELGLKKSHLGTYERSGRWKGIQEKYGESKDSSGSRHLQEKHNPQKPQESQEDQNAILCETKIKRKKT
ncbi:uncharacterized protein LOC111085658 [Limulus polyphemus]|uniref:Uncharacterized protein LOC111085658 n=1 Tax=Limulus polyphemus TaxID=6850 RepID=A0ABM1SBL1_LIMPO|nr:uncharacterized protein LOC111085658 [Limulus polyphemus]